ncbi:MAG: peptide-N4-(N-acetyl-beta- glucosaminyl)asparagine amidase [Bogoriella megaspora]|nr:MAG: peptide-N4-(N-acetyl-beta- glucosaminyl)asparagine amidase [Bogoriella megaspora]
MADSHHHRRGHRADELERWAKGLTEQYRQMLSRNRMSELSRRSSQRRATSPHAPSHHYHSMAPPYAREEPIFQDQPPPSYSSLKNLPMIPSPPTDARSIRFRNQLLSLSATPLSWENPGLLDEALRTVPIDRIQTEAEEESMILQAEAESLGKKPEWGYQDCAIKSLMKWFKQSFFTWVNNPQCEVCFCPTITVGITAATDDEAARGATRVELYRCSQPECGAFARFPRYSDAFVLLQTRRGRVGEWVSCFGMLCRAMNARVRWVWNSEDHVWLEIYSEHAKRWVHADVCEGVWDRPRLYAEGWRRKLGYCIAFSADGAMDVTRRYCRNPAKYGKERTRTPEPCFLHILNEIRSIRRRDMPKQDKFRLEGEDIRERKELQAYVVMAIAAEICKIMSRDDPDAQKAEEARRDGETQYVREPQNNRRDQNGR